MRGKVLGFDAAGGTGAISGSDGKRYNFTKDQWRGDGAPTPGVYVDFDSADGSNATALFPEVKTVFAPGRAAEPVAPPPPPPHPAQAQPAPPAYGQPGGYPQPGAAPGGYPQPGAAPGGYPQPGGARPPYPGQPPQQQGYPGQQAYPGQGGPGPGPGQPYGGQQTVPGQKSHIVAGLLALFLGSWGIHKFYLGYMTEGAIMLGVWFVSFLLTFVLIGIFPLMALGVVAFIEAIIYLTKSDADFERIYVQNKKAWF